VFAVTWGCLPAKSTQSDCPASLTAVHRTAAQNCHTPQYRPKSHSIVRSCTA